MYGGSSETLKSTKLHKLFSMGKLAFQMQSASIACNSYNSAFTLPHTHHVITKKQVV